MGKFKTKQEALDWVKSGKKIRMTGNLTGQLSNGSIVYSGVNSHLNYINGAYIYFYTETGAAYNLTLSQFEPYSESKEDLEKDIISLESDLVLVKAKLAYLVETKQDVFDETEFKVWNTLQVLKQGKKSDLDKAKAIAKLIKS